MSQEIFEEVTQKILAMLSEGKVPWRQPWTSNGPQRNLLSKRAYRGINQLLLGCAGFASPYWLTTNHLDTLGGRVEDDEKSSLVVCLKWKRRLQRVWIDKAGNERERATWIPYCWAHTVFNTDQCVGIDAYLPKIKKRKFTPIECCEKIVAAMPKPPEIQTGIDKAYYQALFDQVNMPNSDLFKSNEEYYSTLFHELVHSTGHISRLDRHKGLKSGFQFDLHDYSTEELVAELGCAMLCTQARIDASTLANSSAYIQGWLERLGNDNMMVIYASARAQKAADYILGRYKPKIGNSGPPQSTAAPLEEETD